MLLRTNHVVFVNDKFGSNLLALGLHLIFGTMNLDFSCSTSAMRNSELCMVKQFYVKLDLLLLMTMRQLISLIGPL